MSATDARATAQGNVALVADIETNESPAFLNSGPTACTSWLNCHWFILKLSCRKLSGEPSASRPAFQCKARYAVIDLIATFFARSMSTMPAMRTSSA